MVDNREIPRNIAKASHINRVNFFDVKVIVLSEKASNTEKEISAMDEDVTITNAPPIGASRTAVNEPMETATIRDSNKCNLLFSSTI